MWLVNARRVVDTLSTRAMPSVLDNRSLILIFNIIKEIESTDKTFNAQQLLQYMRIVHQCQGKYAERLAMGSSDHMPSGEVKRVCTRV